MTTRLDAGLEGVRIVAFESRRGRELGELVRRYGGDVLVAPSLKEVPLADNPRPLEFFTDLEAGKFDLLVLLTGSGTRSLVTAIESRYPRSRVCAALARTRVIARGPKPVAALRELGVAPAFTAAEPNTWREVLRIIDAAAVPAGARIAVQEYGVSNRALVSGLESRGMAVVRVPVYRWALPDDTDPLRAAIGEILAGRVDVAIFTSATQVAHLFQVAGEACADELARRLGSMFVASIGPVCSEALDSYGIEPDMEPEKSRMGQLVAELARYGRERLRRG